MERWHRVALESADTVRKIIFYFFKIFKRSVILIGLQPEVLYHVQIVPNGFDEQPMWEHAQRLQLKTEDDDVNFEKDEGGIYENY